MYAIAVVLSALRADLDVYGGCLDIGFGLTFAVYFAV